DARLGPAPGTQRPGATGLTASAGGLEPADHPRLDRAPRGVEAHRRLHRPRRPGQRGTRTAALRHRGRGGLGRADRVPRIHPTRPRAEARVKLAKAELTVIDIPLSAPYLSSQNHVGKVSTSRTIVRLSTDEGFTGVGETNGTPEVVALLKRMCQDAIGHDVHDVRGLRRRTLPNVYGNYNGRNGWIAYAGLEMAFWDAAGKAMGLSLSQMLGGAFRDSVEVAGLMSAFPMNRAAGADLGSLIKDERNVELVVS